MEIAAVVVFDATPETAAGAPGTAALMPKLNVVVPVTTAPPATVADAVTVNVVEVIATVGVPVIIPSS